VTNTPSSQKKQK
jgi:hypothetical protein